VKRQGGAAWQGFEDWSVRKGGRKEGRKEGELNCQ